jgi:hypothetical protein
VRFAPIFDGGTGDTMIPEAKQDAVRRALRSASDVSCDNDLKLDRLELWLGGWQVAFVEDRRGELAVLAGLFVEEEGAVGEYRGTCLGEPPGAVILRRQRMPMMYGECVSMPAIGWLMPFNRPVDAEAYRYEG